MRFTHPARGGSKGNPGSSTPRNRSASPTERGKPKFELKRPLKHTAELVARPLVEALFSFASRRSDWSRVVRPLTRTGALWLEEAQGPGLAGSRSRAPSVPTKMVARFRSGSLSLGLSTDISAAAEPPSSARRAFKPPGAPPPVGGTGGAGLERLGGSLCLPAF